jgi:hypothetical protein
MKKLYFTFGMSIGLIGTMFGQFQENSILQSKTISEPVKGQNELVAKNPGDVIGQVYDFSDPSNWVTNNSGVNNGLGWVIGTDGPSGFFSGGMGPIQSTSGGNFALFDADGPTGTGYISLANPIDMSTVTNAAVQFESYYRNFQGSAFFEISLDNVTWQSFQVHTTLPLNESTANPALVSVNVTNLVAGQPSVYLRFRYDSGDDYAWMIDDVAFIVGYDDELVLGETFLSAGAEQLDYYQIPENQLQPFTFGARLSNGGINNQTNTALNIAINDGATTIFDESSTPVTLNAFSSDSLAVTTPWSAPGIGAYNVTYEVESDATDQNPGNNSEVLEPITVGGNVYARDNGVASGSVGFLGSNPEPSRMGQYFEFVDDFVIAQVQIGVGASSNEGEQIYAQIRVLNSDGTAFEFAAESNEYFLTASDLGNIVSVNIPGGFQVQAGQIVEVLAGHFGGARFLTAQIGPGAVIYDSDDSRFAQNSLFIVRPVAGALSVENTTMSLNKVELYPNPSSDVTNLSFNLAGQSEVNITITDLSGKVVQTLNQGVMNTGKHDVSISTSSLKSGAYIITLTSEGSVATKRLIVQ